LFALLRVSLMRAVVATRFREWTEGFEGHTLYFDKDLFNLVTIGDGNLVDPFALCTGLAFVHPDGTPASQAEVFAAWSAVKNDRTIDPRGGGAAYARLTTIRLTELGVQLLVLRKLALFEHQLASWLLAWDDHCADAQLVALSKAWANGGLFPPEWPKWTAAFNAREWEECAIQAMPSPARMAAQNVSYGKRIAAEQAHLRAAATTTDPEEFAIWP
jgi:hypothetical protein